MRDGTICLVIDGDPQRRVLLGRKKRGFGAGKWGLPGGKIEAGESPLQAGIRELEEETRMRVNETNLAPLGLLDFQFPHRQEWSQLVHVFVARHWSGEPTESDEVVPRWFSVEDIPYRDMWSDSIHWLPQVLAGMTVRLLFVFGDDNDSVAQVRVPPATGR